MLFEGYTREREILKKKEVLQNSFLSRSTLEQTADYLYFVESVYTKYQQKLIGQVETMTVDGTPRGELIGQKRKQLNELAKLVEELKTALNNKPETLNQIQIKQIMLEDELISLSAPVTAIRAEFDVYIAELQKSRTTIEHELTLPNKLQRLETLIAENPLGSSEEYDATSEVVHNEAALKDLVNGIVGRIQAHVRQVTEYYKSTPFSAIATPAAPLLLPEKS